MEEQRKSNDSECVNPIVRLKETGKLYCSVCCVGVPNIDSHNDRLMHKVHVERFNLRFEDRGEKVYCKKCRSEIEWLEVKHHAVKHKIAPWCSLGKPASKTVYENHTGKFSWSYYCFLCAKYLDFWDSANSHFTEADHQSRKEMANRSVDLVKRSYIVLITHGGVPGSDGMNDCKICNKTGMGSEEFKEHIKMAEHKENRIRFVADFTELQNESESFTNNSLTDDASLQKDPNPENIQIPYNRNMICNFSLQENTEEAAVPERKENSEELGNVPQDQESDLPDEKEFSRSLSVVPDYMCQDFHISYIVSRTDELCKAAIGNDKQLKRKIAKQKKAEPNPYCLICYSEIPDYLAVKDHLKGKRHGTAREKYGCDNIILIEGEHYYCTACDCTVAGFSNVYRHITGKTHLNNIGKPHEDNHERENSLKDVVNTSDVEEVTTLPTESPSCLYIVKQNAKKSFCQICDVTQFPVATKNINDHIASQRHKIALKRYDCDNIVLNRNGNYYCRCCDCELLNVESLYLHIKEKRHMSSLVKVCNKQGVQSGAKRRIETPTLPEDFQVPCQNLLGNYITRKISGPVPSNVYDSSQHSMISNFTVEPNNANCTTIPDRFELFRQNWFGNSTANQNSGVQVHNRFEDLHLTPSENGMGNNAKKQDIPLYSSNTVPDGVEVAKQPELSTMMTSMAIELSRFFAKCNTEEINRAVEEPRRRAGMKPALEFQPKKFYCTVCGAKAEDRTELHVHMATHYTEEFLRFPRSRANGRLNGGLVIDRSVEAGNSKEKAQAPSDQPLSSNTECSISEVTEIGAKDNKTDSVVEAATTLQSHTVAQSTKRSQKIADMRKVVQLLDFDDDYIYDLVEKFKDLELGLMLGLVVDSSKIYCLICREAVQYTLNSYPEHLSSVNHCKYLEEMEADDALFENLSDQFSDMSLAKEYMQEISEDSVRCIICDESVPNDGRSLESHIYHEIHERKCEETRAIARRYFETVAPRMHCDWYDVQKYWCVSCQMDTASEVSFVKHLKSRKHKNVVNRAENAGKRMIYDFCDSCALLWYGYRCTYSYHREIESHKWLKRDGHYILEGLSRLAKDLLASPDEYVDDKIRYLDDVHKNERAREEQLIRDLEKAAKMRFPRARAYSFGSRVSGMGSPDSDIDVFLDCRNVYNGNAVTDSDVLFFINGVHQSLSKDPQSWDMEELLTNCRSPIIKACHRATGLSCDISFENGLAVENTKLIKTFNRIFPMCRKITLFLKQWLLYCDLSGSDRISSYALYWYIIFYLQKQLILPSVATLIAMTRRSRVIAGWEVGVSHDFAYKEESSKFSIKDLLIRFFTFYADFDFRYDVACPLLGEVVKKRAFVDPRYLPDGMERYVAYMRQPGKPEPFRIDSPMCIQDPFDLQHNLTKAVNKVYLNRFRRCCAKSLDLLWSS